MKKLDISRQEKNTLDDAISHWEEEGLIEPAQAAKLRDTYHARGFDWKRLAKYSFWVALACAVLAVLSLLLDEIIQRWLEHLYNAPDVLVCSFFFALATLFYLLGFRHKRKNPDKTFSNEALMLLGVFATAAGIGYLGKILDDGSGHFSLLFLASVIIYGALSVKLSSQLIWIFTLVSLGIWFATETAYHSNWGFRFWGMNYPLRFTLFGALLTLFAAFVQDRLRPLKPFQPLSYVIGLTYLMISLWLLSVFGNYSDWDNWASVRQWNLFYWGLLSTAVSAGLAWYGLKNKDAVAREFGIVFFIINLYTRFFEYLWDNLNRAVFFLILALSFWFVGRWAERRWNRDKGKAE